MATALTFATATPRPDLRDALEEFDLAGNQAGFVGLEIAPVLEVSEAFGEYRVMPAGELLKEAETLRNFDGSYNRVGGATDKDSYATEEHGIEERIDDREARMFRNWYQAELQAVRRCRNIVLQAHNNRVIDVCDAVTNTTAAGVAWDVVATADPVANVRTAKIALRDRIGAFRRVNLVIEAEIAEFLKDNDAIIDRMKFAGIRNPERENFTAEALAETLGVNRVIVSSAQRNTANEGAADQNPVTFASAWTKSRALLYVPPSSDDLGSPQFMRTFHWSVDGSQIGGAIESYGDNVRRSDIVRVRMDTDEKETMAAAAQVITGVAT